MDVGTASRLLAWVDRVERLVPPRVVQPWLARAGRLVGKPELDLLPLLVPRERVAVDVGAARGVVTWHLARLAAAVHAFEANPRLARRLARALPRVRVHACALSDRRGEVELRVPSVAGRELEGLGTVDPDNRLARVAADEIRRVRVPRVRLDDFDLGDVGFLKIDVEGHEAAVLRGGTALLRRCRPRILLEAGDLNRPGTVEEVRAVLDGLDYVLEALPFPGLWLARPHADRVPDLAGPAGGGHFSSPGDGNDGASWNATSACAAHASTISATSTWTSPATGWW